MHDKRDKLIIGIDDDPAMAEHFSRKTPGEKCAFRVEGTLDENHEGVVVLSVTDLEVLNYKGKKAKEAKAEAAASDSSEPVMQLTKRRREAQTEAGY